MTHSRPPAHRQRRARRPAAPSGPAQAAPASERPADRMPAGAWPGHVTYWAVLGGIGLALLWMRGGQSDVRGGTLVMAGVLLAGAAARLGLPDRRAGLLGSRRKGVDAAAFAVLGVGLLVAGLVFPGSA